MGESRTIAAFLEAAAAWAGDVFASVAGGRQRKSPGNAWLQCFYAGKAIRVILHTRPNITMQAICVELAEPRAVTLP